MTSKHQHAYTEHNTCCEKKLFVFTVFSIEIELKISENSKKAEKTIVHCKFSLVSFSLFEISDFICTLTAT